MDQANSGDKRRSSDTKWCTEVNLNISGILVHFYSMSRDAERPDLIWRRAMFANNRSLGQAAGREGEGSGAPPLSRRVYTEESDQEMDLWLQVQPLYSRL